MHRRDRDVSGIAGCFLGHRAGLEQGGSQPGDFRRNIQKRKAPEQFQSSSRGIRVSGARLIENKLRNKNPITVSVLVPPFPRDLLVAGNDQVPGRPGCKVTGNSGLQIQARFHDSILARADSVALRPSRVSTTYRAERRSARRSPMECCTGGCDNSRKPVKRRVRLPWRRCRCLVRPKSPPFGAAPRANVP